ncbi:MAG: hypothetical protein RL223_413 [Pseudomonadota bacterium]
MRALPVWSRWASLPGSGGAPARPIGWGGLWLSAAAVLSGCAPVDDWREVRVGAAGLTVRFPCRPEREQRPWSPSAAPRPAELLSCRHQDALYAVFSAELAGPDEVRAALLRLPAVTATRWHARLVDERLAVPVGATPWPQSRWQHLQGQADAVGPVSVQMQVFGHGLAVHQVTVVTPERAASAAADTFLAGIRFVR